MRRTGGTLTAIGCALVLAACGGASVPRSHAPQPILPAAAVPVAAATTDVARADDAFGLSLLRRLWSDQKNLLISPYSIATALQMTLQGARGQTATEMLKVLRLANAQTAATGLAALRQSLAEVTSKAGPTLRVADTVWVQQHLPLVAGFREVLTRAYAAALHDADFIDDPESARNAINDAIAQQTNDKIRDLIPQGLIDNLTRLVLANAIYLKASWAAPFPVGMTRNGRFQLANGDAVTVPRMHQTEEFSYARERDYQAVQLPCVGGRLAMTVLLPDHSVQQLLTIVARQGLSNSLAHLRPRRVDLTLPKFRFTTTLSLNAALAALGMPTAFDSMRADFSGITTAEPLYIKAVLHKAFVDVNERGTEAAAATAVVIGTTALIAGPTPKVVVDRPFLFTMTDTRTGAPLFLGVVSDPRVT